MPVRGAVVPDPRLPATLWPRITRLFADEPEMLTNEVLAEIAAAWRANPGELLRVLMTAEVMNQTDWSVN